MEDGQAHSVRWTEGRARNHISSASVNSSQAFTHWKCNDYRHAKYLDYNDTNLRQKHQKIHFSKKFWTHFRTRDSSYSLICVLLVRDRSVLKDSDNELDSRLRLTLLWETDVMSVPHNHRDWLMCSETSTSIQKIRVELFSQHDIHSLCKNTRARLAVP